MEKGGVGIRERVLKLEATRQEILNRAAWVEWRIQRALGKWKNRKRHPLKADALHRKIVKLFGKNLKKAYSQHMTIQSSSCSSQTGRLDVKFDNPDLRKVTGCCFQILRYVPAAVKARLQEQGQWDDVAQTLYLSAIEFWKKHKGKRNLFGRKAYKEIVMTAGHNLDATLRDLMGHRRKSVEICVDPKRFHDAPLTANGHSNYVKMADLTTSIAE